MPERRPGLQRMQCGATGWWRALCARRLFSGGYRLYKLSDRICRSGRPHMQPAWAFAWHAGHCLRFRHALQQSQHQQPSDRRCQRKACRKRVWAFCGEARWAQWVSHRPGLNRRPGFRMTPMTRFSLTFHCAGLAIARAAARNPVFAGAAVLRSVTGLVRGTGRTVALHKGQLLRCAAVHAPFPDPGPDQTACVIVRSRQLRTNACCEHWPDFCILRNKRMIAAALHLYPQ